MKEDRELILDTETTGLFPEEGHRVIEIGIVEMISKVVTGREYQIYLNPERDIPIESFRVHNISEEFLRDKPVFTEQVDEFLKFLGDSPIIAHNANFDIRFLNSELKRAGKKKITSKIIDTLSMARLKFPRKSVKLENVAKYFSIPDIRKHHGAILDARLLAQVYVELTGGIQENFVLSTKKEKVQEINVEKRSFTEKIVIKPSVIELKNHQKLLQKITKCSQQ